MKKVVNIFDIQIKVCHNIFVILNDGYKKADTKKEIKTKKLKSIK